MTQVSDSSGRKHRLSKIQLIGVVMLSWFLMLGIDFFLHAGLLGHLYAQPSPFLLLPIEAFRRIPLGYLSFFLLNILICWLMLRLEIVSWRRGMWFGFALGGLIWGAMTLGLLSISTASPNLMLGWFVGQTVELGAAGALVGAGLAGSSLRKILTWVFFIVLILIITTVVMQNTGLAPTIVL